MILGFLLPHLSVQQQGYDLKSVVSRLVRQSSRLNRDYGDYLAMKATINLPFPGYPSQFLCILDKLQLLLVVSLTDSVHIWSYLSWNGSLYICRSFV